MPIFQYQQLFQPLIPIIPPPSPPCAWLPTYPNQVPHHRPQTMPSVFGVFPPVLFPPPEVRASQVPVEILVAYTAPLARASQVPVEILTQYLIGLRQVRLSQAAVEVIYPFTCAKFVPPPPAACVVALVPLVPLSTVPACPLPNGEVGAGGGGGGIDHSGGVG